MNKVHTIHKGYRDLCEKTVQFFVLLEERKWAAAERFMKFIVEMELDGRWLKGYTNALTGMIVALRDEASSAQPHILEARKYDRSKLQEDKKFFNKALRREMDVSFDMGYFQAWLNYVDYLLQKTKC